MWENYVITERLKRNEYLRRHVNSYFWRTYDKKEIDLVEEEKGGPAGFEVKWGAGPVAPPKDWTKAYPRASFKAINRENYLKYIEQ